MEKGNSRAVEQSRGNIGKQERREGTNKKQDGLLATMPGKPKQD